VKKNHWTTIIVGIVIALGIYAIPAVTQQTQQEQPLPTRVAVIDVAQVIKAHPEFMQRQEVLQKKVNEAEASFGQRQEKIVNKRKALDASTAIKPGSPQHQQMLDEIANEVADFERDTKTQQRKFALENSQIMYDTYQNIKATIGRVATAHGIAQVTDYREFESNPADPQSVAEDMDQRLVWFSPRLNITQSIITQLYADRNLPVPTQLAAGSAQPATGVAPAQRTATAPAPGAPGVQVQR